MKLADSKAFQFYEYRPGMWDFFRCMKCSAIITYEQEQVRLLQMRTRDDVEMLIHCTSRRYQPTQPIGWREWIRPNVVKYTLKLVLARGFAPWAEAHCNWVLPAVEWFVSNETTR